MISVIFERSGGRGEAAVRGPVRPQGSRFGVPVTPAGEARPRRERGRRLPSLSPSFFRKLVADGSMPRPRLAGGRRIWDVDEFDLAFKALPREGGEAEPIFSAGNGNSWADFK